jgi:hypothetical protein
MTQAEQSALRRRVRDVQSPIENAKILVEGETAHKTLLDPPAHVCGEYATKKEILR